jgi:hypothetical protein
MSCLRGSGAAYPSVVFCPNALRPRVASDPPTFNPFATSGFIVVSPPEHLHCRARCRLACFSFSWPVCMSHMSMTIPEWGIRFLSRFCFQIKYCVSGSMTLPLCDPSHMTELLNSEKESRRKEHCYIYALRIASSHRLYCTLYCTVVHFEI